MKKMIIFGANVKNTLKDEIDGKAKSIRKRATGNY